MFYLAFGEELFEQETLEQALSLSLTQTCAFIGRTNGDYSPCPSAVTLHPFLVHTPALLSMFYSSLPHFLRLIKM